MSAYEIISPGFYECVTCAFQTVADPCVRSRRLGSRSLVKLFARRPTHRTYSGPAL